MCDVLRHCVRWKVGVGMGQRLVTVLCCCALLAAVYKVLQVAALVLG